MQVPMKLIGKFTGAALIVLMVLTGLASANTANTAKAVKATKSEADSLISLFKTKDAELQTLLRAEKTSENTERIKFLINGIFDFEELGRRALGTKTWSTMPAAQKERFTKAFKNMVESASIKKLEVYRSDSTTYEKPEVKNDKATVITHVYSNGQESVIVYKLFRKEGEWKAWDLVIDDLSTARNYGEQFRKILETSDMNGLIAKLENRTESSSDARASKADNVKAKSEKKSLTPTAAPAKGSAK